jgi:hypothetical protein
MWAEGEAETSAPIGFERLQEEEDALLFEGGFEPTESNLLWLKESTCYGREAALQVARSRSYGGTTPLP